jgi:hypothetical protein
VSVRFVVEKHGVEIPPIRRRNNPVSVDKHRLTAHAQSSLEPSSDICNL